MELAGVLQEPYIKVDPRTKMFLLFFVGIVTFMFPPLTFEVAIYALLCGLLVLNKQTRMAIIAWLVFVVMLAMDLWGTKYVPSAMLNVFFTIIRLGRMLLPLWVAGILMIRTITVTEFIAAFRKMKLPNAVIIPFSVMFRFIPTVSEEWKSIRNAMKFRGIGVSFKNVVFKPLQTLEYMLIPLLMSTATIADELAAASLARGLDSEEERTCVAEVRFGGVDYVIVVGCIAMLVIWMVTNK